MLFGENSNLHKPLEPIIGKIIASALLLQLSYDVLVKRKASLDQIRKWLTTLGVLDIVSPNIEVT